ncbi:DotH/IcmK family type IV secretion protein [Marinomonas sp. 2405UD68-3]|uniref:DotH/IcmK family type IV secretion protein n=1 Tax=Marinomonas sp. 2405UD68-3 TaxID=3391835 RepID=UPI0039C9DE59
MKLFPKKLFALCAITFTSFNLASLALAADESPKIPFNIEDVSRNVMLTNQGPVISDPVRVEATLSQLRQHKVNKDQILSNAFDNVTPIRQPIFISTDPSAELAEIYVTQSKPTTIAFLTEDGKPFPVTSFITKSMDSQVYNSGPTEKSEQKATNCTRFCIQDMANSSHILQFLTNVGTGWTTVDLVLEGIPYPISVKLVAGLKYHTSSQAIIVSDNDLNSNVAENQEPTSLIRVLSTLANYGTIPDGSRGKTVYNKEYAKALVKESASRGLKLEYMSPERFKRPLAKIYKTRIDGVTYYLLRTTGVLKSPEFIESAPSVSIAQRVWAYAIPAENLNNILSINYAGGNHIYAIDRPNRLLSKLN